MSDNTDTIVEQVTVEDIDNLLGTPGGDDIMTDPNAEKRPEFFQKDLVDLTVLDPPDKNTPPVKTEAEEEEEEEPLAEGETPEVKASDADTTFEDLVDAVDPENKGGRPPLDKGGMAQLVEGLIKQEKLVPFDDGKALEDYTQKDFEELIEANISERERKIREETPAEFFDSLPPEMQYAAKYIADGGKDLRGLFAALARVEDNRSLDPDNSKHAESIVRNYLSAKQFGTAEEIQDEIESYKDLEKLEAKAKQFKPKLDKMQEEVVQRQVAEQDHKRQQQEQASMNYMNSVYEVLKDGELNGVKLNSKMQNMLYAGLTQPNYPSISGKPTNMLGHLLERHQFVEPNHGLVAEALWLLQDPEGYRAEISKGIKNKHVEDTVRTLKTEQASKNSGSVGEEPENKTRTTKKPGLQRPSTDFFKRT